MKLYDYAGSANCYKVKLLLAQLARPYEIVDVEIFRGESRTPEFLHKNPAGRVPVLELASGECLAESNAILCYLATGTALWPEAPLPRAQVLQWLFFEQYEVEPTVGTARYWKLTGRDQAQATAFEAKVSQGNRALTALDQQLAQRDFLVGDAYSIADIALYAYTHVAEEGTFDLAARPALRRWLNRVEAQPRWVPGPAPYSPLAHVAT